MYNWNEKPLPSYTEQIADYEFPWERVDDSLNKDIAQIIEKINNDETDPF